MSSRIYTPLDDVVTEALDRVTRVGRVAETASQATKLHVLVEVANETLRVDEEREEKIAAYKELASDVERANAIREANLAAAAAGIL